MNRLLGKIAAITGGTSGLGLAAAEAFLREGARVVVVGRDQKNADQAKDLLAGDAVAARADVSKLDELYALNPICSIYDPVTGQESSMKASKFLEAQIAFVLKQAEDGSAVAEVCRKAGIMRRRFTTGGRSMPSEMKRLRQLEEENNKLKRIVADLSLDKAMLQHVLPKKL
jgi:putative transposase